MKKSTSLKKLSLKTETIGILTDLTSVRGGLPTTWTLITVGTGGLASKIKSCNDTCGCPAITTFCTTE